jgi:hypothetical protein
MVKNVLIGKNCGLRCPQCLRRCAFVESEFILCEVRGRMVNRGFRIRVRVRGVAGAVGANAFSGERTARAGRKLRVISGMFACA